MVKLSDEQFVFRTTMSYICIRPLDITNTTEERSVMKKLIAGTLLAATAVASTFSVAAQDKNALMKRGQAVYTEYCKTCHQANGQGLGTVYPPVAKSDYIKNNPKATIIKEVVKGKSGKVKVNGKEYNGVMTPIPKKYTDADVAAVLTYVYNSWGNPGGVITEADVKKAVPKR